MTDELEMEFEDETVRSVDRLVDEGWFENKSDFVAYAIQNKPIEDADRLVVDPTLDQRISEINQVYNWVDDETLQEFFLDTSNMMTEYSRLAHDIGREEDVEAVAQYMSETFVPAVANSSLSGQDADNLLDRTLEVMDGFYKLSDIANAGYEGTIEQYEEEYFDSEEMKDLLMGQ